MQIKIATFLTMIYAIIMITVMVGLLVDAIECLMDPNVLFFLALAFIYTIAALSHGEVKNLVCGIVYFMAIPSCFIFLQLYMVANLHDISWGTRQNKDEGAVKKKKDMGMVGGMVHAICGMCIGDASCTECCCNEDETAYPPHEEEKEHGRVSHVEKAKVNSSDTSPSDHHATQTDGSSEDEMINEGNWFDSIHKLRRHTDNEYMETEKSTKNRYTTAELGVTEESNGYAYKNPAYKKKAERKGSMEGLTFIKPAVIKQPKRHSPPVVKRKSATERNTVISQSRNTGMGAKHSQSRNTGISKPLARNTGMSINSVSSLRRSLLKRNKSFVEQNLSLIKKAEKHEMVKIDPSDRDSETIKRHHVLYGGITRKTLTKFYNIINHSDVEEPRDIALLIEYFTYPTQMKVSRP